MMASFLKVTVLYGLLGLTGLSKAKVIPECVLGKLVGSSTPSSPPSDGFTIQAIKSDFSGDSLPLVGIQSTSKKNVLTMDLGGPTNASQKFFLNNGVVRTSGRAFTDVNYFGNDVLAEVAGATGEETLTWTLQWVCKPYETPVDSAVASPVLTLVQEGFGKPSLSYSSRSHEADCRLSAYIATSDPVASGKAVYFLTKGEFEDPRRTPAGMSIQFLQGQTFVAK